MLFLLNGFRGLCDHLKSPAHFRLNVSKIRVEQRALRVDDHVRRNFRRKTAEPHCLAQAAFHAVAVYRASQPSPHGEPDTNALRTVAVILAALQIKNCHVRRKVATPVLVNPLKICMPQKAALLRKAGSRIWASGVGLRTFFLRTIFRDLAFPYAWSLKPKA